MKVFQDKPGVSVNWVAYILSLHLCKNYDRACQVIDTYLNTMTANTKPYEIGEMHIYKAIILEEKGDINAAIELLKEKDNAILDKLGLKETLARLYIQTGDNAAAEELIYELLSKNAENRNYYNLLNDLNTDKTPSEKVEFYKTLAEKYPNSKIIQKIMLEISGPEHFE